MGQREAPVVQQRRLRAELRRIREDSGRSPKAVAEALGWPRSKVIRIETGAGNASTSDVMALLYYYRFDDADIAEDLLAITRARQEGWWDEYRSIYSQQFLNYLAYEDAATRIRQYFGLIVPGLLQTEEYARALFADYRLNQKRIDRGIHIRMRRQELFGRPHCPELMFVLDEAVIHRWVGGSEVMLRQLSRLKELARHPSVHLQIVPFTDGMYAGMHGSSFTIFEFSAQDRVVTFEQPDRDLLRDDPQTSSNYLETFRVLQQIACPEGEIDKIIDPVIDRMRLGATIRPGGRATGRKLNGDGHLAARGTSTSRRAPTPGIPDKRGTSGRPTVGLVTAIPEEFVAMRALLDDTTERHVAHDPADYILGTLPSRTEHGHVVALTLLGATATNAAANGCANLVRSFPTISAIIMVGIAAGVPNARRPDKHVRLGDVVVATQIVDFDHVRAVDGRAEPRRPLSLPSSRLTQCADILRTDELSGHRTWEQWLDISRCSDLADYVRPPEQTDVLHDVAGRPLRHPRRDHSGHRKGYPKIHCGPIGSSNRSLRDATTRDQIAAQHGIIAIEMEGAGIGSSSFLNGREWFVVRGISDYADAHRSDVWRRNAALAAAYVRALLARCLPLDSQ